MESPGFVRIIPLLPSLLNQKHFPPDLVDTNCLLEVLPEEVFFRRELHDPDLMLEVSTTVILLFSCFAYHQDQFDDHLL